MAAVNHVCIRTFTDDRRCVQAHPGMVVAYDTAVPAQAQVASSHIANGVLLLASDTTNTHPVMVAMQKLLVIT